MFYIKIVSVFLLPATTSGPFLLPAGEGKPQLPADRLVHTKRAVHRFDLLCLLEATLQL